MIQGNASFSRTGVLRGLHYHLKQADLWAPMMGSIQAALHDVRVGSPTEGVTETVEVGEAERVGLYIPSGVAHGFLALTDCLMTYLVDSYYDGSDELGVAWD